MSQSFNCTAFLLSALDGVLTTAYTLPFPLGLAVDDLRLPATFAAAVYLLLKLSLDVIGLAIWIKEGRVNRDLWWQRCGSCYWDGGRRSWCQHRCSYLGRVWQTWRTTRMGVWLDMRMLAWLPSHSKMAYHSSLWTRYRMLREHLLDSR